MTESMSPAQRAAETKKRRTHDRLLRAADVFEERGLETSVDDVARAARVSQATFYNFFPTRNAYVKAAFAHHVAQPTIDFISDMKSDPPTVHSILAGAIGELGRNCKGREQLVRQAIISTFEVSPHVKPGEIDPDDYLSELAGALVVAIEKAPEFIPERFSKDKLVVGSWSTVTMALYCFIQGGTSDGIGAFLGDILEFGIRWQHPMSEEGEADSLPPAEQSIHAVLAKLSRWGRPTGESALTEKLYLAWSDTDETRILPSYGDEDLN